jgi:hypothetical protein
MPTSNFTNDIFEILGKGQFISSNTSDVSVKELYREIDENEKFEVFYNYFIEINLILERGDEYFYFTRKESKADLERKLEKALQWIDVLDFLKTYDNSFGSGYRNFTSSDITSRTNIDAELKSKLEGLNRITRKDKPREIVDEILKMLQNDRFIEIENEITESYKVLAAFSYLENLIATINIIEETKYEIPQ